MVHRIIPHIPIKVPSAIKPDRILIQPASDRWIIVPRSKSQKPCVLIIKPAGKAKGLKAGIGIRKNIPPGIISDLLGHGAVLGIDHINRASHMVMHNAIGDATLDDDIRAVKSCSIDKKSPDAAVRIKLGGRP